MLPGQGRRATVRATLVPVSGPVRPARKVALTRRSQFWSQLASQVIVLSWADDRIDIAHPRPWRKAGPCRRHMGRRSSCSKSWSRFRARSWSRFRSRSVWSSARMITLTFPEWRSAVSPGDLAKFRTHGHASWTGLNGPKCPQHGHRHRRVEVSAQGAHPGVEVRVQGGGARWERAGSRREPSIRPPVLEVQGS